MNKFDRLETLARRLIEGGFQRLFQTRLHPTDLAHQLVSAIERGRQYGSQAQRDLGSNRYRLLLNPDDYATLVGPSGHSAEVVAAVRSNLRTLIPEGDFHLTGSLDIQLDHSQTVPPGRVEIKTEFVPVSSSIPPAKGPDEANAAEAWLLQVGERRFRLGEPVVRIGRALDNDLVLSDPTVSRYHAQLRWRTGCYHIYPAASPAGNGRWSGEATQKMDAGVAHIAVNQQPITQHPLAPGDQITLGDAVLTVIVEA